jgi:hypothetical protein
VSDYDARAKPRATLSQLRLMRSRSLQPDGERVVRQSLLGSREVWERRYGNGERATYELVLEQREDT